MKPAPTCGIITIGTELLKGSVLDTNSHFLSRCLTASGFQIVSHETCDDQENAIRSSLGRILAKADVVFLSGGLGPTPDDVTREALAGFFGVPLKFSDRQYAQIRRHYRRYGSKIPAMVRREAEYPRNAKPLINRHGIAIGFYIPLEARKMIIVLPGVPRELERMYVDSVQPLLRKTYGALRPRPQLVVKTLGLSEPDVMERLGKDFFSEPFDFGIYPAAGEVSLRLYADKRAILSRAERKVKKRLGDRVYAYEEIPFSHVVSALLLKSKRTLAVAESCTGGLLASMLTELPGSSRFFKGGWVVYSNELKERLGVPAGLIRQFGAVSSAVAEQLACQARLSAETHFGIGITGVAGPGGGSPKKPVGLVYVALASKNGCRVEKHLFFGSRRQIQTKAALKSMFYVWELLRGPSGRR